MQQAALFRRQRQLSVVNAVLRFRASCLEFVVVNFIVLWFVCEYLPDLRETLGFICADCLSILECLFSRR